EGKKKKRKEVASAMGNDIMPFEGEENVEEAYLLEAEDLLENPTDSIPVCLVLDVSLSMAGDPIDELQAGVETFFNEVRADEVARYAAEIAVVTFGGTVKEVLGFASFERQSIPYLTASGNSPMGQAVETALEMLEKRKESYKSTGVDYFQPWMVLTCAGAPTDSIAKAKRLVDQEASARRLTVFPIGIGDDADLDMLGELGGGRAPMRLQGLKFRQFFQWLSQSVARVSQSIPGEKVPLDTDAMSSWAHV
ncbi:MAG: VWA domain-containing protein, partial [Rhodobacteraceae bacterium]|nr:VWA domain-containing protein [Paracoccaceae bacterium]